MIDPEDSTCEDCGNTFAYVYGKEYCDACLAEAEEVLRDQERDYRR